MDKDETTQPGKDDRQGGEDELTLEERIAEEATKAGGPSEAKPDTPSSNDAGGQRMSMQEALARRRAELQANLRRREQDDPASSSPEAADKTPTVDGGNLSLQEVIDQQRRKSRKKPSEETPSPSPEPRQPAEEPSAEQAAPVAPPARTAASSSSPARSKPLQGKPLPAPAAPVAPAPAAPAPGGRQKLTHAMLVTNTFLLAVVGGVLIHTLSKSSKAPSPVGAAMTVLRTENEPKPATAAKAAPPAPDANEPARAVVAAMAAPSWAAAEGAFANQRYSVALTRYSRLLLASRRVPSEAICGEFYQYRIAQSMGHLGRARAARELLERLTRSDSPILRAAANADLARVDEIAGSHLQARVLACRALAALKTIEQSVTLEADCDYLVARALTGKANSFYRTTAAVPWSRLRASDVFKGRNESEVRRLLDEGLGSGGSSVSAGEIRIARTGHGWTLICRKAALEDVLHQLASKTGKDVRWDHVAPAIRRRTVQFVFREVAEQRACELACGMAGLLARFTWDEIVVHDPQASTVGANRQKELLGEEAVSAWRRFSLRFSHDERAPEAQFAQAALYELAGDTVGATKQYQLIGRQYQNEEELAPAALMRSARLRMDDLDYPGARKDLGDLIDLYPRYPRTDEVYLMLGRASMSASERDASDRGKHLEAAAKAFRKVYDLNASPTSRAAACLEIGECFYCQKQYDKASTWLSRNIDLTRSKPDGQGLARAYLMLGRSELARGNPSVALEAFHRALAARPLRKRYVEAVLALGKAQSGLGRFGEAMATLRRIEKETLSDRQRYEYLIGLSGLYRAMGLPDRARAMLRKLGPSLSDRTLKAQIAVERARCLWAAGDLSAARQGMSDAMPHLSASVAHAVSLDLGRICMEMDEPEQAIAFAEEVLRGRGQEGLRKEAATLLGDAYLQCGRYAEAVRTLGSSARSGSVPAVAKGGKDQ